VNQYKEGSESDLRKSIREAVNDKVVPIIRQGVDKVFETNPKELINSFINKKDK
jgi:hypothetical protein